jgi:hypothetical protein
MSRLPCTPKPKPKWPLTTMAIGATFTRTFATRYQRKNFRRNVSMQGRRYGKKFQCKTDGLSVSVMRIG